MSKPVNIAQLIDADNTTPERIDPALTVMAELGQVNIRHAYGDFPKNNLAKWDKITNKFGICPQQQFDVCKGKNATDIAITIDAIDLLYQGKVDGFGNMTADSDFTPLVTRLRQDGILAHGFGKAKTQQAFKSVYTRFIEFKKLITNYKSEVAAQDKDGNSLGSEGLDTKLMEMITAVYSEAEGDEKGYANLSHLGQIAGNRSSFDVRNHGFKSVNEMFDALDNFKVERRENHVYLKRRR